MGIRGSKLFALFLLAGLVLAASVGTEGQTEPWDERKVVAPPGLLDHIPGLRVLQDYGSYVLYQMPAATVRSLSSSLQPQGPAAEGGQILLVAAHSKPTHSRTHAHAHAHVRGRANTPTNKQEQRSST